MAPKKSVRWSDGGGEEVKKPAANGGVVTRSSSTRRRPSESLATARSDELPKSKKAKPNSSPKGKGKGINEAGKIDSVSAADHLKSEGAPAEKTKTIIIEHCKQCNSFKTRAVQVKNGLEKGLLGITVLVNPEKPRRGCFEIREEGGKKFISLLDMNRPFKPMKALDMDKVISDIIAQIG